MAFHDLGQSTLDAFIRAGRGTDATLWVFQHIPKTAGSSFSVELGLRRNPYRNIFVDDADDAVPHHQKLTRAVDDFLAIAGPEAIRSASGHLRWDQVARLVAHHPDCRVMSFLRDPVARVISDFRYQRTPMHPPHKEFIARFPTLESYVADPWSRNKMAFFLLGDCTGMTPGAAIARIGQTHAFLGLLEMYPMSFNIAFRLMGEDGAWPATHARRTPDLAETAVEVTPAMRDMIRAANSLDQAIYDHVHAVLVRHREAFRALADPPG